MKYSRNLKYLEAFLDILVGQRVLKIDFSYGGELMLHVGEPLPYSHPGLAAEKKGSWILGTRASWWSLVLNDPPSLLSNRLSDEQDEQGEGQIIPAEEFEKRASRLAATAITAATPQPRPLGKSVGLGIALFVELSDKSRLVVLPNVEPDEEPKLADWELFTPYHTYLTCGPGLAWSYLRSDIVDEEKIA
jgi:hypothetical protein